MHLSVETGRRGTAAAGSPRCVHAAIAAGSHPVSIAVARFPGADERVAFAQVRLSGAPATSWRMGPVADQETSGLGPDGELLRAKTEDGEEHFDLVVAEMDKTCRRTRSWADWRPSADRPENVVCFSSGWGDGCYPSFYGRSARRMSAIARIGLRAVNADLRRSRGRRSCASRWAAPPRRDRGGRASGSARGPPVRSRPRRPRRRRDRPPPRSGNA